MNSLNPLLPTYNGNIIDIKFSLTLSDDSTTESILDQMNNIINAHNLGNTTQFTDY